MNSIGAHFLASIDLAHLRTEATALQLARASTDEFRNRDVASEYLANSNDFEPISTDPWSTQTFHRIRAVWAALETHNRFDRSRLINHARYRRSIMHSHMLAWEWLDVTVRNRCIEIHRGQYVGEPSWFDALVEKVDTLILTNTRKASIPATDYTFDLNVEPYQWVRNHHAGFLSDERELFVVDKCLDILACWLGYDRGSVGLAQAWYIRSMVDAVDESVLYLKRVHDGYMRLKTEVLGNRQIGKIYNTDFGPLVRLLALHPLSTLGSPERLLLADIACAVEGRIPGGTSGLHVI